MEERGKKRAALPVEIRLTDAQVARIAEKVKEAVIQYMKATEPEVDKFMTAQEAAEFCGYSINTIYAKARNNEIPYVVVGRRKKYLRKDIINYVRNGQRNASAS